MKKSGITILIAFFTAWTITSFAQSEQKKIEREVIIIKEKIDANGKKTIKKLVKRGFDITDEDIDVMMQELDNELDYNIDSTTTISNKEIRIEIESDEDLSDEEIEKILKEHKANDHFENTDDIEISIRKSSADGEEIIEKIIEQSSVSKDDKPRLGILIESIENERGVTIQEVLPDSPAEKAGLQKNDIIQELNHQKITSVDELMMILKNQKEKSLPIKYLRGKESTQTIVELIPFKADRIEKKIIKKRIDKK